MDIISDGARSLIETLCNLDGVPWKYAELWIDRHYEFFLDTEKRVWVNYGFQLSCWVPEIHRWLSESEMEGAEKEL